MTRNSISFQVRAVEIRKAQLPAVDNRSQWTGSDDINADHRRDLMPSSAGLSCNSSVRYDGAALWRHLNMQVHTGYAQVLSTNVVCNWPERPSHTSTKSRSAEQLHSRLTELVQKNLIICSKYIYITYWIICLFICIKAFTEIWFNLFVCFLCVFVFFGDCVLACWISPFYFFYISIKNMLSFIID